MQWTPSSVGFYIDMYNLDINKGFDSHFKRELWLDSVVIVQTHLSSSAGHPGRRCRRSRTRPLRPPGSRGSRRGPAGERNWRRACWDLRWRKSQAAGPQWSAADWEVNPTDPLRPAERRRRRRQELVKLCWLWLGKRKIWGLFKRKLSTILVQFVVVFNLIILQNKTSAYIQLAPLWL